MNVSMFEKTGSIYVYHEARHCAFFIAFHVISSHIGLEQMNNNVYNHLMTSRICEGYTYWYAHREQIVTTSSLATIAPINMEPKHEGSNRMPCCMMFSHS
jgi:hypothetical protein